MSARDSLELVDAGGDLPSVWRNDALMPRLNYDKFAQTLQPSAAPGESQDHPQFVGDAIGDTIGTASDLAIDTTITSLIDSVGDHDVFRINLVAGQTYTFSMERTDWGSGIDSYLDLLDGAGAALKVDDDGGIYNNAQITFTATSSGTYYLVAHTFSDSSTGGYALTTNTLEIGNTSPDNFNENGKPMYSWEQAAFQINRDFQTVDSSNWPGDQASWAPRYETPAIVTYAFRASAPATMPEDTAGFSQFNAAQIAAAQAALAAWASVANIVFVRVDDEGGYSDNASILFGNYSSGASAAAAFAFLPVSGSTVSTDEQGDVWVNVSQSYNANPVVGNYGWQALLHEIGHAIGLSHPGDYNAAPGVSITYANSAEYYQDSRMFTVMSYFDQSNTGGNLALYASLPQLHDIAAIQHLYGANTSTRAGDTVYGFTSNTGLPQYTLTSASQGAVFSIWDAGGNDTLNLSGYSTNDTIDLREEAFSTAGPGSPGLAHFNISIARGAIIENGIGGSGNDTIIGNSAANTLTGNGGDDILDGGAGADTLIGGAGNDTYYVDSASDTIVEIAGGGADQVVSSVSWTLSSTLEYLELTGDSAINATGNDANNTLGGNDQDNVLNGMGGNDSMWGGGGNDTFIVDSGSDFAAGGDGYDIVQAYVSWSVNGGQIEEVQLLGSALNATGTGDNERLVGNELANTLNGYFGNDTLVGGLGADTLIGGVGNDTIQGEGGADTINYTIGDGADAIDGGSESDTLAIAGSVSDEALLVSWNGALITGVAGGSIVNVESITIDLGAGVDSLTYTGSSVVVVDLGAGAASGFTSLANIENVTAGGGNDTLTGNALANLLDGGGGNDVLSGGDGVDTLYGRAGGDTLDGGIGGDVMFGGDGDDIYVVDNAGDVTTDNGPTGGNDTVQAAIAWTLTAAIENLTLIGGALNGTGNELANTITGNALANILNGKAGDDVVHAGDGADTLYGGDGADQLYGENDADLLDGGNNNDALYGGAAVDTLYGRAGADILDGGAGADTMFGGDGDDTYYVDDAGDMIGESAGAGTDLIYSSITRALGQYQDNLILTGAAAIDGVGNILANELNGNDAANTLSGLAGGDHLYGFGGNDTLNGGDGFDVLLGMDGNDVLDGGNDPDQLNGGAGDDTLYGREGSDTLIGDDGNDILWGGDGDDHLEGGAGDDLLDGGNGNDYLDGETLYGRQGDDVLHGHIAYGGDGNDSLTGGTDSDHLEGSNGADTLVGNEGNDVLLGQANNDIIDGGLGNDTLTGGAGDDTFVFRWVPGSGTDHDIITDFVAGGVDDTLDFSPFITTSITWSISQVGGDTLFTFSDGDTLTLNNVNMNNLVVIDPWHYG